MIYQAYRFALDPNNVQRSALASHSGAAPFVFNWGLELVRERLEATAAGAEVSVPWTLAELRREWNRAKTEVAPWWAENSKEAYSSGLDRLARALRGFMESRRGGRRGRRVGFPRYRKRGGRDACRFTTGAIRIADGRASPGATAPGTLEDLGVDPGSAPAALGWRGPHPFGDGVAGGRALVLQLHGGGGAAGRSQPASGYAGGGSWPQPFRQLL